MSDHSPLTYSPLTYSPLTYSPLTKVPFNLSPTRSSVCGTRPSGRGRGYAVSDILEEWVPRVYRFALRLSNDPHTAEDLAQETFLRAWRHRDRLRDEQAARVWLFRITANLWRDQLRRTRSPVARAGSFEGHVGTEMTDASVVPVLRQVSEKEELTRALEAMNALPPRQREVLYLSACEELASAEIAEVLGITVNAVKANLSLARKSMRQKLPDFFPGASPAE
jgi:RNA polymerase sigma-70 factor, ECF subfamily